MKLRIAVAVAVALALGSIVATSSSARAQTPPPPLIIRPGTTLHPTQPFSISVAAQADPFCANSEVAVVSGLGVDAAVQAGADGAWQVLLAVPGSTDLGTYTATALCSSNQVEYPSVEIQIVADDDPPGSLPPLSYSPASVAAGSGTSITVSNTTAGACQGTVIFIVPGAGFSAQPQPDADGLWQLVVPASTWPPGGYEVVAACHMDPDSESFGYDAGLIEVSDPNPPGGEELPPAGGERPPEELSPPAGLEAATAVVVAPKFTG